MPAYGIASSQPIRRRLVWCGRIFILLLLVIIGRAAHLQLVQGERLGKRARDQYIRSIEQQPRRGAIVDARGKSLAETDEVDSVYADPSYARKLLETNTKIPVEEVAKALNLDLDFVQKKVFGSGSFVWLKRRISEKESAALRALSLKKTPFSVVKEHRRIYPQKELGAHVLGMVGFDEEGLVGAEGLEKALDEVLKGNSQAYSSFRDVRGNLVLAEPDAVKAASSGARVELTIDSFIQQTVEARLKEGFEKTKAVGAMAVVMDPRTGAILALSNRPSFNPNAPGDTFANWRNRAVTDLYEPGSVIKCFLFAGALSDGLVNPMTPIDVTGGKIQIGKKTVSDSHPPGKNVETATEVLATSSNVGTARVGLRMGAEGIVKWMRAFGFGERTRVILPGEGRGVLQDPKRMGDIGAATTSFGQGMTASALQVTTALSALANGGRLMRPYVVRKIVAENGEVILDQQPEVVREVITPEASRQITQMMVAVTTKGGTGMKAAVEGFQVAGKTGTAQKADPKTRAYGGKRFSSFMGFVPADDPRLAIYVAFDEPQFDVYGNRTVYGGSVAAPIFKDIAKAALLQLGVTPGTAPELPTVTNVKAKGTMIEERFDEDDDLPEMDEEVAASASNAPTVVPDVRNLPARSALRILSKHNFDAVLDGSGRVVAQKPEPGRTVVAGTKVHLTLETN
jgi:cell division protein FtsI (penicillin-binding protein 3)